MNNLRKLIKEVLAKHTHDCGCGCHGKCGKAPTLNENLGAKITMTENMSYHVNNKKPLTENTFRYGSDAFLDLWAEARYLYSRDAIHLSGEDKKIITETNLGDYGLFEGQMVPLDLPMEYENQYEPILEDIKIYGKIYEDVNIENSYKIENIKSDDISYSFIFTDKHGIKRKLQYFKGNSVKLLWLNPSTEKWTTDNIPSKYEDEKVMNTFGMILVKVVLPKYGSFHFKALNAARYRLFRALIYNNLDKTKYEMDFDDNSMEIEVYNKNINEASEYQGKKVQLNKPKRGGSKKFYVYVRDPKTKKVKKVSFGAAGGGQNLAVKIRDPKARRAFAARQRCGKGESKTSAKYWACRVPRYAKILGLKGTYSGFW